ncbi:MAG: exopolyphosphatase [Bacteroidetes bacterium]|nr:exopolyphosphatase [Bacteroidota bacterium]
MRLATIDIGTNTALLLIAEWDSGRLVEVFNATGFVRLGEGLDRTGMVSDAAFQRLESVLQSHMEHITRLGADHIIVTGTSASRDARNSVEIRSTVRRLTGAELTILSGDEEAKVTFDGATAGIKARLEGAKQGLLTVVDVGGGSTEFVQGTLDSGQENLTLKASLDMGAVRMTERFFTKQPAPPEEVAMASKALQAMMQDQLRNAAHTSFCIGASGTARIMALVHLGLDELGDSSSPSLISREDLGDWVRRLFRMTYDEIIELHPAKMQGRADVLPAGALILYEILKFTHSDALIVSPYGVRHGVAIRYFRES